MKRLIAAGAVAALLSSLLAGCAERDGQSSALSPSEEISAPESSQSEFSVSESFEPESSDQVSTAAVRRELFQFQNNGKDYTVAYPVFLGMKRSEALNAVVEETAPRDVEQNGCTEERDASSKQVMQVTIRTDYELTCQSGDSVSVLFTISFGRSDAAHPSKYTRTINFDLQPGKVLAASNLLEDDEDLYEVIWEAVHDNAPAEIVDALPFEIVAQNKVETSVYITPDEVGFSLPVSYALGDVYQIVVPYFEMKPYLKVEANPEEYTPYELPEEELGNAVVPH